MSEPQENIKKVSEAQDDLDKVTEPQEDLDKVSESEDDLEKVSDPDDDLDEVNEPQDWDKVCQTLDKLTLDSLLLVQEQIELKLNIENAMSGGESHLAKSRYILGHNNVSALQLPTENSPEFSSCLKVEGSDTTLGRKSYELREIKKTEDETVQEPLRWFGVLVPQNLTFAQKMFRQALQWSIKSVNIQNQLLDTMQSISDLKELKNNLTRAT
ncbi:coiled-coil domain-containing protein 115-like [Diabrotica virgifera virgifera]|uniref:Vacuolar ATPase assembly protein VMA22 n=1 Tax=Diabrotica virgifera virgifera TaxID=50390 RepID=A0A6P7FAS4_DIAVI|nr:coiled-coil domain-containing protein 115-like [Diabrotica virgifera virgifera]